VSALALRPDGTKIVLTLDKTPLTIIVLQASDGSLMNAYTDSGGGTVQN
jgi:hypothetical protein